MALQPSMLGRASKALVRAIDPRLAAEALRMHAGGGGGGGGGDTAVCLATAQRQHDDLVQALREDCGLESVVELPSDGFADSVFIEDTAVAVGPRVMLTVPGAPSRQGETARVGEVLRGHASGTAGLAAATAVVEMAALDPDARMDGGDVLYTGRELLVGLSTRTNAAGALALQAAFPAVPVRALDISVFGDAALHLKSACSMAGPDHLVVGGDAGRAILALLEQHAPAAAAGGAGPIEYRTTVLPDAAASNMVYVNGTLLRRCDHEFPASADGLRALPLAPGGAVVQVEGSELAKVDGALTCCSLLLE